MTHICVTCKKDKRIIKNKRPHKEKAYVNKKRINKVKVKKKEKYMSTR